MENLGLGDGGIQAARENSTEFYKVNYHAESHDSWLAPYVGATVEVIRNSKKTEILLEGSKYDITGEWVHYRKMLTKTDK